ncbi:PucR family transcriptional regulator [Paenibacillus sp. TRM 82003]|nr:PucR family transcriptional regulator [Paenibacillus sp. TRM 82003]
MIPNFRGAVVLAGASGLQRQVLRANIVGGPGVVGWVRPGEFLMTTGYPFKEDPELLVRLLPELVEKGVAALGVRQGESSVLISKRVVEAADALALPIIELPSSVAFSDAVQEIMGEVLLQETRELALLQGRFLKLSQLLLEGAGLEALLAELERMLGNPVFLIDEERVCASPGAKAAFDPAPHLRSWYRWRDGERSGIDFLTIGERRIRIYVSPVCGSIGPLLLLADWSREHTAVDRLTIDRVGVLAGLEASYAKAQREVESKYFDQFLQDWLAGRLAALPDIKIRAEACGFKIEEADAYYVGTLRWTGDGLTGKQLQQAAKRLHRRWFGFGIRVTIYEGAITCLVAPSSEDDAREAFEEMKRAAEGEGFAICLGRRVGAERVFESCAQARRIHRIAESCGLGMSWVEEEQLGVFRLLHLLPESEEVNSYRDRFVVPLLDYDRRHQAALFDTVASYFRHNRNANKASVELFTHYNTVNYRIGRVCEILGLDASDGDDMLQLQLAVKLEQMRPSEKALARRRTADLRAVGGSVQDASHHAAP